MPVSLPIAVLLLSPVFFGAGAALVSIPIAIHFMNRRRYRTVEWAAMEFLLRAMKKNRRRLKFEQLLLLATRCALLLLAGLALARPLGCDRSSLAELAGRRTGLQVIVIDNGLSMQYEADRPDARTHLDQAKRIAHALVGRLQAGGEAVALVTTAPASPSAPADADGRAPRSQTALPVTYDLKAADAAIDRVEPSFCASDLAGALGRARDVAAAEPKLPNKALAVLDDSSRSTYARGGDALASLGRELAAAYAAGVTHYDLGRPGAWNQAVVDVRPASDFVTPWFPTNVAADARGYGPAATDPQLLWKLDDAVLPPGAATVHVGPEAADPRPQVVLSDLKGGGSHVVSASLAGDDRLPCDNVRWRAMRVAGQIKVLIVEGERGVGPLDSSGVFLDEALNPRQAGAGDRAPTSYAATERISDLELGNKVLGDYRCVALCGVGNVQDAEAAALERYVRAGGALMVFMGEPVTAENYNATLYKHHLLPGPLTQRVTVTGDQPGRNFDFNPKAADNPYLPDFDGQENTGLDTAEIYGYWQVALPAGSEAYRVLNFKASDDPSVHDPAVTVHSLGGGRVLFFATSAGSNPAWSEFPAKPNYPSLMHDLLLHVVNGDDAWMNLTVGDPLTLPATMKLTAAPTLRDATGADFAMSPTTAADGAATYRSVPLLRPGVYTLSDGDQTEQVAVNVPADAADLRPLDAKALRSALGDVDLKLEGDGIPPENVAAEASKDLGWAVMLGVLGLIGAESLMAMRFGHTRKKA